MLKNKFLQYALESARSHDYAKSLDYQLCAVIVSGGRILSVGFNKHNTNGLTERYKIKDHTCSVHAEIAAVAKARKKIRLEGSKIYVVRIHRDGTPAMAKPCEMCQHVLFNYGIKKAIFTVDPFTVSEMKLHNPALNW